MWRTISEISTGGINISYPDTPQYIPFKKLSTLIPWQMKFVFLDMVRSIPQISASGYFNISKRLFPQVNFHTKKTPCFQRILGRLFKQFFFISTADWDNFNLFLYSLPISSVRKESIILPSRTLGKRSTRKSVSIPSKIDVVLLFGELHLRHRLLTCALPCLLKHLVSHWNNVMCAGEIITSITIERFVNYGTTKRTPWIDFTQIFHRFIAYSPVLRITFV